MPPCGTRSYNSATLMNLLTHTTYWSSSPDSNTTKAYRIYIADGAGFDGMSAEYR